MAAPISEEILQRARRHSPPHPVVGELSLYFEKMLLPTDPGQMLVTYAAEPGSPSEAALRLLAGADRRSGASSARMSPGA
ncbi:hypothetical protein NOGI109294_01275 [Nocardiopsis gilva]|uniref:MmyB family transcriptional regulator n=1 Tax=Nocardiopsis gilva TaxID=280236 RepID=UPI00034B2A6F|nr:hypothetical protein [Nocardiopsis gilva]